MLPLFLTSVLAWIIARTDNVYHLEGDIILVERHELKVRPLMAEQGFDSLSFMNTHLAWSREKLSLRGVEKFKSCAWYVFYDVMEGQIIQLVGLIPPWAASDRDDLIADMQMTYPKGRIHLFILSEQMRM